MVGINTNFYCPHCNYNSVVNLGITQMVYYKNKRLALDFCPKCNTKVAFEIVKENENKMANLYLGDDGIKMKDAIVNIISSNLYILKQDKETIFEFVCNKLKEEYEEYSEDFLNKHADRNHIILQFVLSYKLYDSSADLINKHIESYIYDKIKNECEDGGCICY